MYIFNIMYIQILLLREKCPNTKFFVVRIFPHLDCPHLDCTRRDTPYLSVFSPNAGKYGPEKTPYLDTFQGMTFLEKTTGAKRPRPRMSKSSFLLILTLKISVCIIFINPFSTNVPLM